MFNFTIHEYFQGALAVEARTNDWKTLDLLSKLTDIETLICCAAERAYLWRLVSSTKVVNCNQRFVNIISN